MKQWLAKSALAGWCLRLVRWLGARQEFEINVVETQRAQQETLRVIDLVRGRLEAIFADGAPEILGRTLDEQLQLIAQHNAKLLDDVRSSRAANRDLVVTLQHANDRLSAMFLRLDASFGQDFICHPLNEKLTIIGRWLGGLECRRELVIELRDQLAECRRAAEAQRIVAMAAPPVSPTGLPRRPGKKIAPRRPARKRRAAKIRPARRRPR